MKKVLIICDVFPPAFAPRMGYLVKYIKNSGWDADVITQMDMKDNNYKFLLDETKVYRVPQKDKLLTNNFEKLKQFFTLEKDFIRKKQLYISAAKTLPNPQQYHLILISTAWNLFVLYAGYEIAKAWEKPFIVDLRDIHEQKPQNDLKLKNVKALISGIRCKIFDVSILKLRNRCLKNADFVTTVSEYHVGQLSKYNSNTNLIFNGFDPELFYPSHLPTQSIFKIVYFGSILDINFRNPGILFSAANSLKMNGVISKENFRIQFYTQNRERHLVQTVKEFESVSEFVDFYDYVESSRIPEILNETSIALVLTNFSDNRGPKGILTTKFFEYLGMERPILCVKSDEGELEAAIIESNAGVAARNINEAYNFIEKKFREWEEKGYTTISINKTVKEKYSRKLQANQFVEIFEKVISSKNA